MADYTAVSKSVPSSERSTLITNVAAGDLIDLTTILWRPARAVQFIMTDAADTIDYRLNSHKRLRATVPGVALNIVEEMYGVHGTTDFDFWASDSSFPLYQGTGSTVIQTADGLKISSIEVNALSLSSGTVISIVAW